MYVAIVSLTMLVFPLASIIIQHFGHSTDSLVTITGRWFVFWAVGVRLGLAGLRQIIQPGFTAKNIFHLTSKEALPLVRELGVANAGTALVGLLSLMIPSFVLPAAVSAGLFYAVAGLTHLGEHGRGRNENVAMVSDFWAALVLYTFIAARLVGYWN